MVPTQIIGSVQDEKGLPLDGATVFINGQLSVVRPDGLFKINAKPGDKLTISAFGYQPQTVSGKNPIVTLGKLPTTNVRILAVDQNDKELAKAVIIQLDPNTSAPHWSGCYRRLWVSNFSGYFIWASNFYRSTSGLRS